MGETSRETFKKKLYPKKASTGESGEDADEWIEMERTKKLYIEDGSGFKYQSYEYTFDWPDEETDSGGRTTKIKKIGIPGGNGDPVEVGVIRTIAVECGDGFVHYVTKKHWINSNDDPDSGDPEDPTQNLTRKTHTKKVHTSSPDPDDDEDTNKNKFIKIEVIDGWRTKQRDGFTYKEHVYHPNWPGKDDDDDWGAGGERT